MSIIDLGGGPAFPTFPTELRPSEIAVGGDLGMTLHEWYAGKALGGVRITFIEPIADNLSLHNMARQVALGAWAIADAMIAERDRRTKP